MEGRNHSCHPTEHLMIMMFKFSLCTLSARNNSYSIIINCFICTVDESRTTVELVLLEVIRSVWCSFTHKKKITPHCHSFALFLVIFSVELHYALLTISVLHLYGNDIYCYFSKVYHSENKNHKD